MDASPRRPSVAVVGASSDRSKYGNISVRAHLRQGYEVFPVNPKGGTIEGLTVYKSLSDVPCAMLDRISIYLPPALTLALLDEISRTPHKELWLNPGAESPEVVAQAEALGLNPIQACSIIAVGLRPDQVD